MPQASATTVSAGWSAEGQTCLGRPGSPGSNQGTHVFDQHCALSDPNSTEKEEMIECLNYCELAQVVRSLSRPLACPLPCLWPRCINAIVLRGAESQQHRACIAVNGVLPTKPVQRLDSVITYCDAGASALENPHLPTDRCASFPNRGSMKR